MRVIEVRTDDQKKRWLSAHRVIKKKRKKRMERALAEDREKGRRGG